MIDEYWTFMFYGYHSDELPPRSGKPIVAMCDNCCQYRVLIKDYYRDLCHPCAQKGKVMPVFTEDWCRNMSIGAKGRKMPPRTEDHCQHLSAAAMCISYEEWNGYSVKGGYCGKFDEACRERIREKYNRLCFVCNRDETKNKRRLAVHHVDMNKDQGCDGYKWSLVPLCTRCHPSSHCDPLKSRIEWLLKNVWI